MKKSDVNVNKTKIQRKKFNFPLTRPISDNSNFQVHYRPAAGRCEI
jgi:hypothetical protein